MITKISDRIWKFTGTDRTNVYFLDFDKKVIIDTGYRKDRHLIDQFLGKLVDFKKVDIVIFTHLHYDHIGNFDLFPNAEFYASQQEIDDFRKNQYDSILNDDMVSKFKVELKPLTDEIAGLEVIPSPGHTRGSICLWYKPDRVLFTGDTLFFSKNMGRTDLPNSAPKEINKSIMKLIPYNFRVLAPGHDY